MLTLGILILVAILLILLNKQPKPRTIVPNDTTVEETMNRLNSDMLRLIEYMKNKYSDRCENGRIRVKGKCVSEQVDRDLKQILQRIKYDPKNVIEHIPNKSNMLTAYNENKGDEIGL
jgi:hypothetical protein